jgi:putative N6-adenine-specific DNA methylase
MPWYFAICPRGLEASLADELRVLGATGIQAEAGGVAFAGDTAIGYAANLHSRLASRVLWRIGIARIASERDLYAVAAEIEWETHFGAEHTLRVDLTATHAPLRSLEFATLRVKDAIVDRLRARTGARPSIDRARPDVRVFVHVARAQTTLYLDLSGEPLFKRGWRADKGEAPLKENLAAGLLHLAGWTPAVPLLDPFCGSGTIVIEAACMATRRAPGLVRTFAFEKLRGFDRATWRQLGEAARAHIDDTADTPLRGSDIATRVIEQAHRNAELAGLQAVLERGNLRFESRDARQAQPPAPRGVIVTNPPYGEQSQPKSASVAALMRDFGDRLKQAFAGWDAWLMTGDRGLPGQMRLQESRKTVLYNGPIECRFFRFPMTAGNYRSRSLPEKGRR